MCAMVLTCFDMPASCHQHATAHDPKVPNTFVDVLAPWTLEIPSRLPKMQSVQLSERLAQ